MSEREATANAATIGLPQGEMYRGDRIGNYEVLTQLSVGGMAELFLCFTQGAGAFRKFGVVKRILPDVKTNDSYVKMFYDEARITWSCTTRTSRRCWTSAARTARRTSPWSASRARTSTRSAPAARSGSG